MQKIVVNNFHSQGTKVPRFSFQQFYKSELSIAVIKIKIKGETKVRMIMRQTATNRIIILIE